MRVLMLGWEFPPFISGGLGTACFGLTKGMDRLGLDVVFVLPKSVDSDYTTHVKLLSPLSPKISSMAGGVEGIGGVGDASDAFSEEYALDHFSHVQFKMIPSWLKSPYQTPAWLAKRASESGKSIRQLVKELAKSEGVDSDTIEESMAEVLGGGPTAQSHPTAEQLAKCDDYAGDILSEVQRYANMAVGLSRSESFDVIHAHDWMTYPAGLAIARLSGKPLVVHVHSTEFDRSGESVHNEIYNIERRGMHGAMKVICVSHLTRKICEHRYGVPHAKAHVCYNGIEQDGVAVEPRTTISKGDKIVLFLGRLTFQKGPEYFIAAAKKVLEKVENVKFIIAGSGDMTNKAIEMAAEIGIGHKVLFTGFLRGDDVERVYQMADVYVMPSISEPFGIAPLEAIRHDVPVIISKNSGVSEVLKHALKVDFWDVDEMANKTIAVLKHPPLSQTLREYADLEVRQLTWDGAAKKCREIYQMAIDDMSGKNRPEIGTAQGIRSGV